MSRAFVSEKGDWNFCRKKRESCTYADETGGCIFSYCRIEREKREELKKNAAEKAEKGNS